MARTTTKMPTKRTFEELRLVTTVEVARYLGVSRAVVYRAIDAGLIRAFQSGPRGKWLVKTAALDRWLDARAPSTPAVTGLFDQPPAPAGATPRGARGRPGTWPASAVPPSHPSRRTLGR